jgi:TRAP-type C4-dicarboxylate transport system substrate-binding protein
VTLPVVSAFAADDVINLTVQSHDPQTSATGAFLDAWAAKVKKASNGKLNVKVFHGGALGGPKDTVDMVLNGTADSGWGLPSFFPGRFPMTEVMSLPMMGIKSSTQGSAAMWELYSTTDYLKKEYENFKVILVHTNCDSPVSTKKVEIKTVDQFKGMKIRGNAGPATEFIKQLGASPIAIVIGELYSSLEKGVLDAVITDWHAIKAFKLAEQINFYLDEHMGVSPYFLLMNKAKYASLPADMQKVIDSVSGEGALDVAGPSWDKVQNEIIAKVKADKKKKIYTLSAAEHAKLQAIADATKATWVKGKTEAGYPAQAVADKAAELVAKYAK